MTFFSGTAEETQMTSGVLGAGSPRRAMPASPRIAYIRSHTALRGLAAMLVVAYHLQFGSFHRLRIETATPFFERGYLLVDLFFILSGFVISLTNDGDRRSALSVGEIRGFYVARVARIYPLHLFCLFYIVVYTLGWTALVQYRHTGNVLLQPDMKEIKSFLAELLLIQSWIPGSPRWNIPSWSISAELVAYAVFPALIALRSRLTRLTDGLLLIVPIAFYLFITVDTASLDLLTGLAVLRCLSGFMLGMMLFNLRGRVTAWADQTLALCQFVAVFGILLLLTVRVPDPFIIPLFALLVITTWQDRGPVSFLLCNRPLLWMGDISYSIYLNHVCLIFIITPIWFKLVTWSGISADLGRIVQLATCLVVVLMVSQLTFTYVEKNSRRYLLRVMSRDKVAR